MIDLTPGGFGVASCHLTGRERAISTLLGQSPTFLTIKTTSPRFGGDGRGRRTMYDLGRIGLSGTLISDGPRTLELLSVPRSLELYRFARGASTTTKIGASVLAGDRAEWLLKDEIFRLIDYVEINTKYIGRAVLDRRSLPEFAQYIDELLTDVASTTEEISSTTRLPVFVKLSRDASWLFSRAAISKLDSAFKPGVDGFITSNTSRQTAPGRRHHDQPPVVGALSGVSLLPETLRQIAVLRNYTDAPIIASGGLTTGADIALAAQLGANAIQLCSVFNIRGLKCMDDIRREFESSSLLLGC